MSRVMVREPEELLQLQPTSSREQFVLVTLKGLDGNEPLPKQAAADFWVS